jgi:hypothetical protein
MWKLNRFSQFLFCAVFAAGLSGSSAVMAAPLDHGSFARSCAPWDGAAVRFEISEGSGAGPSLVFSLFTGAENVQPGTYTLPLDSHTGSVAYCTAPNTCKTLNQGEVRLTAFSPWASATISYDVTLPDGQKLSGEAALTGSDEKAFCG